MSDLHPIDPEDFVARWGAPFVCRDQDSLNRATGGSVKSKTLANLDSLGKGPKGRVRIGRKIAYPSHEFFRWFVDRIKPPAELGRAIGNEELQGAIANFPHLDYAEEKLIREIRDKWQGYAQSTGDRKAYEAINCLNFLLIEGGCRP